MVKPFHFTRLPLIYFGSGKLSDLAGIAGKFGTSVLLVTGERSFINSPQAKTLSGQFGKHNIQVHHITVKSEPSPELVDEAVRKYSNERIDVVISIGGGSVIDAGKAISAMLGKTGSVMEYLEVVGSKEHSGTKVPFIAIPTTSGTGSEATKNAVISKVGKGGFKRSLRHDNLVPDIAFIDPELTLNCPPDITAAAGMDCFTQLAEAYLSDKSNEYTDALAVEGFKAVKRSLLRCFTDGDVIDARTDMSFAALTSGICLANAGLGAVHGLAGTIGAMFDIPHGVVCGTLMAVANEVNVRELRITSHDNPALKKYANLGKIFSDYEGKDDDYYIDSFVDYLHGLTEQLMLPRLGKYGIRSEDISGICQQTDTKNNPVRLSPDLLAWIISRRL
ncbi:MAG: iron-containing alcohol dehydrogenase [Bacteroidales bacterium]